MRILVFSLGVVFQSKVLGGSQKVLRDIAVGLGRKGYSVTILCPYREDNCESFVLGENAVVKPILPLRGAFPLPYGVSPFALTEVCRIVGEEILHADLFYCHDGGLNIEFLKNRIPTVISLRDFCYAETLLGALNFNEEHIIVNSMHTYLCLHDSFRQVNPRISGKVSIVYNGYCGETFKPSEISQEFYDFTGLPKKTDMVVVGFPHRPDSTKGFVNALKVIRILKQRWGERIKLLIPQYMDKGLSDRTDETYNVIQRNIEVMGLENNILTYEWIPYDKMPEYYSYCDLILCIGSFVEAFSNVSVESLLCGTPVIAANTSTYRTMPIKEYIHIVPYGDIEQTSREAEAILTQGSDCKLCGARDYILSNLTIDNMVDEFERVFGEAMASFRLRLDENSIGITSSGWTDTSATSQCVKLAAWCEYLDEKFFDDYTHRYYDDMFHGIVRDHCSVFTMEELQQKGITPDVVENALRQGILVRV